MSGQCLALWQQRKHAAFGTQGQRKLRRTAGRCSARLARELERGTAAGQRDLMGLGNAIVNVLMN